MAIKGYTVQVTMAQKWNLQDIRPIENRPRPATRPPETIIERPRPPLHDDVDDTEPIVIEDGNKTRRTTCNKDQQYGGGHPPDLKRSCTVS